MSAGTAIIAAAWAPSIAAVLIAVAVQEDWSSVLRLVVTAIVYAPVAAIVLGAGRGAVALILGALAITSGLLSFAVLLDKAAGVGIDLSLVAMVARQPEIATLAIMPWLLTRHHPRLRAVGVGTGSAAIVLDISFWLARHAGAEISWTAIVIPLLLALVSFLGAAIALGVEWRRSTAREREALVWSGLGAVLLPLSYLRVFAEGPEPVMVLGDAGFVLAQGLLPVGLVALAIGSSRAGPPRPLFLATVWVQSLAFAISLYLVVGVLAVGAGVSTAVAGGCAAAALALVFSSMIGFVRQRTARLYYGLGTDLRAVLARLGEGLAVAEGGAGLAALADSLRGIWRLSSVTITPTQARHAAAGSGAEGRHRLRQDLAVGGRNVGVIELSGPDPLLLREVVAPLLRRISPLLGVAVVLAVINHEVASTRHRTLRVRAEERHMLQRELRDDVAPALAGIGFEMAAVRRLIAVGAPAADGRVEALRDQVAERAEEIRLLARSMLPAALEAGDLDGALRELAERFTDGTHSISVLASGADVLDSRTQLAHYLLAAEALGRLRRLPGDLDIALEVEPGAELLRIAVSGSAALRPAALELLRGLGGQAVELGGQLRAEAGAITVVMSR